MKHLILVCCLFFLPQLLFSQLSDFKVVQGPEMIHANISKVRDIQNRICAAVQIITHIKDLQYESDRGVVQVEVYSGMEIVYLSPDERFLRIIHPDFNPLLLSFSDYNIKLGEFKVIQVAIADINHTAPMPPPINQTALLSITTCPGAFVYLDGKLQTQLKNIKLLPSRITIRAEMEKAVPEEITLLLKPNDNLEISLYPKLFTGNLWITVFPKDAKIELLSKDDDYYASTGAYEFIDLPIGEYEMTVKRNGFKTINETLFVSDHDTLKRDINMEPIKGIDAELLTYEEDEKGLPWYWATLTSLGVCYGVAYFATDGFSLNNDDPGEGTVTVIVPKISE